MDFKEHPKSIAEIKSSKTNRGSDWTPRDALIALLRDIDAGQIALEAVFICAKVKGSEPGFSRPFYSVAAADPADALGTIEMAKMAYQRAGYGD